jgi:hypothetical protein
MSLQRNKFWHQKHIPLFAMGEVPVSHKDGDYTGLYTGLCYTLLKRNGTNKSLLSTTVRRCNKHGVTSAILVSTDDES